MTAGGIFVLCIGLCFIIYRRFASLAVDGKSILARVALLLGVFSFIDFFGVEKQILAIALGAVALDEIKKGGAEKGKGIAVAGLSLGAISLLYSFYKIGLVFRSFP